MNENQKLNFMAWVWVVLNIPFIPFVGSPIFLLFLFIDELMDLDLMNKVDGPTGMGVFVISTFSFFITMYLFFYNKKNQKQRWVNFASVLVLLFAILSSPSISRGSYSAKESEPSILFIVGIVAVGSVIASTLIITAIRFFKK